MDNGFAFRSISMLALVLLVCLAVQDVWGSDGRSKSWLASASWRRLGRKKQSDMAKLEKAAKKAYESLSNARKDFSDEEVVAMVKAIEKYEAENNSHPLDFGGLKISEVLRHSPPSVTECVHTPELKHAVNKSRLMSPGWNRFIMRIFKAQMDVCDEDARQSVASFKAAHPEEWQLIANFVKTAGGEVAMQDEAADTLHLAELRKAVFGPTGENSRSNGMNGPEAQGLARKLKNACDLFWSRGLVSTHKSVLRDKEAARYRMICKEIHKNYQSIELAKLIQEHASLGAQF